MTINYVCQSEAPTIGKIYEHRRGGLVELTIVLTGALNHSQPSINQDGLPPDNLKAARTWAMLMKEHY